MQCKGVRCDSSIDLCIGTWCTATIIEDRASNIKTIERGCSPVISTSLDKNNCSVAVTGTVSTKRCMCNDINYCNSLADLSFKLNENLFASKVHV